MTVIDVGSVPRGPVPEETEPAVDDMEEGVGPETA
jgi:hypothetical protein